MPSRTASVSSFFCRSISFICKELIRYCFGANILPYWNRELDYFRRSQDGTHSSRDECIHLRTNALISGSMLSSRDQCSHLRINALISGSWRRPTEARTCSDDAPAPQRNGALPPHSETRRQNHPRTESGKLRPLCAI